MLCYIWFISHVAAKRVPSITLVKVYFTKSNGRKSYHVAFAASLLVCVFYPYKSDNATNPIPGGAPVSASTCKHPFASTLNQNLFLVLAVRWVDAATNWLLLKNKKLFWGKIRKVLVDFGSKELFSLLRSLYVSISMYVYNLSLPIFYSAIAHSKNTSKRFSINQTCKTEQVHYTELSCVVKTSGSTLYKNFNRKRWKVLSFRQRERGAEAGTADKNSCFFLTLPFFPSHASTRMMMPCSSYILFLFLCF